VEYGAHDELVARGGAYARLIHGEEMRHPAEAGAAA
jgi:ABC-type multidrug transport system fused ATPase/permease subunit